MLDFLCTPPNQKLSNKDPNFLIYPTGFNQWSSLFETRAEPLFKKSLIFFRLSLSLESKSKRDRLISKPLNLKSFFFLFDPTNFVHYIYTSQWWCVALYPIHKGKSKWNTITVQLGNSIKEATLLLVVQWYAMYYTK